MRISDVKGNMRFAVELSTVFFLLYSRGDIFYQECVHHGTVLIYVAITSFVIDQAILPQSKWTVYPRKLI